MGALVFTLLLFWLYTKFILHRKMIDFGISFRIKGWAVTVACVLPLAVVVCYCFLGKLERNDATTQEIVVAIVASMFMAIKAGVTEEILFRGYIMKLLESRFGRIFAVLVPSFIFGLVHIPSMETFTVIGLLLLIISGTLVGVMFSLLALKGDSIANSAIVHAAWNFVMITEVLHITTTQGAYGTPIFTILLSTDNPLITGSDFGIEASIISIIAYAIVCAVLIIKDGVLGLATDNKLK